MQDRKLLLFFAKFLSLVLAVTLLLLVLNRIYVNGAYYSDTYGEVKKFENVPSGIALANTGTSHGRASFRYGELTDLTTFNFALSGEDIYHDFQTLKHFSAHLAEGCIVAIPTSYFSFCMSTTEPSQKRYYSYLDKNCLRGFSYETLINSKYLPVLRSGEYLFKDLIKDHTLDVGGMMLGDDTDVTQGQGGAQTGSTSDNALQALEASLRSHAAGRAESWRAGYLLTGEDFMEENRRLLSEMVNYCKEQGWRPILVTTPIHSTLNEAFSKEELETYYFANMRTVSAETNVPWWDMSHDPHFSNTATYYSNSDHLSQTGGTAFTRCFLDYLTEKGYL